MLGGEVHVQSVCATIALRPGQFETRIYEHKLLNRLSAVFSTGLAVGGYASID